LNCKLHWYDLQNILYWSVVLEIIIWLTSLIATVIYVPQIVCVCYSTVNIRKCKKQVTELLLHMISMKFWNSLSMDRQVTTSAILTIWHLQCFAYCDVIRWSIKKIVRLPLWHLNLVDKRKPILQLWKYHCKWNLYQINLIKTRSHYFFQY
jgi:hypothetical protein